MLVAAMVAIKVMDHNQLRAKENVSSPTPPEGLEHGSLAEFGPSGHRHLPVDPHM